MENTQKLFAFKLAGQEDAKKVQSNESKWQIRDGVAMAGCSDATGDGDWRCSLWGGRDNGPWC